jgi:hypothetical protein
LTVQLAANGSILLEGICPDDDAETLLQFLLESPNATVDWRACESAHGAVIQVMLAVRPNLLGPPGGSFLREHMEPLLRATPSGVAAS